MPNWNNILDEVTNAGSTHDIIRRKYTAELSAITGRNTIVYYSGWLQKGSIIPQPFSGFSIEDGDKNGFMAVIHNMDRSKGLDLVLHTPGGDIAATESLVDYLRSMFGNDIRAIIPQIAMSAGTMVSLSCKEILMGKHSSLGPVDPQIGGIPAHGVIEEYEFAKRELLSDPRSTPMVQVILSKYHPTLIGECQKAVQWSRDIVREWLMTGMFLGEADAPAKAQAIVNELADHAATLNHSRHISAKRAQDLGVKVSMLEDDQPLQDAVLTLHHVCIQTLSSTPAYKIIENQMGVGYIPLFQMFQRG